MQLIFKRSCFLEHLVHVLGGTASVAHRQNHCGSTANNVTTGERGWDVRLHLVIHDDGVLAAQLIRNRYTILDVLDELGLLREAADAVTARMTAQP